MRATLLVSPVLRSAIWFLTLIVTTDVSLLASLARLEDDNLVEQGLSSSLQGALSIIRSVQELPSCNKMAAAALIHSCATLETPIQKADADFAPGSDLLLDESKKIYAARLAVCELHDAKVTVPRQCQPFLPTARSAKKRSFRGLFTKNGPTQPHISYPEYEALTEENLDTCLSALHDYGSGQGWTSYSNNKKNAVAMCHAVRGELEKDEQIHLFKVLASTTADIEHAFSLSKQEWDAFRANFQELKSGMRQFYVDIYDKDTERQQAAATLWAEAERQMQEGLNGMMHSVNNLQQAVDKTGDSIGSHRQRMETTFAGVNEQLAALATQSHNAMGTVTKDAASLSNVVAFVEESLQQGIMKGAYETSQNIAQTNKLVATANDHLAQYFMQVDDSFSVVNAMALGLASIESEMQRIHEDHKQQHLELQSYANKTKYALELTSEQAGKLHAVFSFWANLFMHGISNILPRPRFLLCFTTITLVAFAAWRHFLGLGVSSTCCIAFATGLLFTSAINITSLWSVFSKTLEPSADIAAAFVCGMVCVVFIGWGFRILRGLLDNHRASQAARADYSCGTGVSVGKETRGFTLPINNPRYVVEALKRSLEKSGRK